MTVVRLPNPGDRHDPIQRIISVVGRTNLALADALHAGNDRRPYAVVRRRETLDVAAGTDELAQALLSGDADARLVIRFPIARLVEAGCEAPFLRVLFWTPTAFRVAGLDHLIPDPFHVFGPLHDRWNALGWPELPQVDLKRIAVTFEALRHSTASITDGHPQRGFVGVVRFNVLPLSPEDRAVVWTLARFGEYRGVGRGTGYGLGRIRILALDEAPEARSVWESGTVPQNAQPPR